MLRARSLAVKEARTQRTSHDADRAHLEFQFRQHGGVETLRRGQIEASLYTRYGNPTLAVAEAKIADLNRGSRPRDGFRDGGDFERFAGGAEIGR